jgi:hypothetical protein
LSAKSLIGLIKHFHHRRIRKEQKAKKLTGNYFPLVASCTTR